MVVGEFTQEANLVILGGGPAGYAAAFRAAELGVEDIVIVDPRQDLGGVCLHAGCIPSKTLLHIVDLINLARESSTFGVSIGEPEVDPQKIRAWIDGAVSKLAKGLASRAKSLMIQHLPGTAHFEDGKHIAVTGGSVPRVKFRRAIIATGSKSKAHPQLPFDGERVISPEEALRVEEHMTARPEAGRPRAHGSESRATETPGSESRGTGHGSETRATRILILGSNYMAAELASIYRALRCEAMIACKGARLLPEVDRDLVRPLERRMNGLGVAVAHDASVSEAAMEKDIVRISLQSKSGSSTAEFDRIIVARGQDANLESLNLGATQVQTDDGGFIIVDHQMKTGDPRIFAAGDVTGGDMLADVALAQGRIAAEVIAGRAESAFDHRAIPHAIFTDPNIAWCGVMQEEAETQAMDVGVAKAPWGLSGRAVGMNAAEGLTKIIYDKESQVILGVGMVGRGACEMIGEAVLAIEMGATLDDLAATMHPHPTMCELLTDAARSKIDG